MIFSALKSVLNQRGLPIQKDAPWLWHWLGIWLWRSLALLIHLSYVCIDARHGATDDVTTSERVQLYSNPDLLGIRIRGIMFMIFIFIVVVFHL